MGASHWKKHYWNWNWSSHLQLHKTTTNKWPVCSNKKLCAPSKTFCVGITTRNLHQKLLKFGCILPNLANICLHKSATAKCYAFTESDQKLLEKTRQDMVGGPPIVFTRRTVVADTCIRDSTNWCKTIVGINDSQLYVFSMCQSMPTGLYTR